MKGNKLGYTMGVLLLALGVVNVAGGVWIGDASVVVVGVIDLAVGTYAAKLLSTDAGAKYE